MSVQAVKTSFTAEWPNELRPTPYGKYVKGAWDLASVILFPIGITRLAYYKLQKLAAALIHPATVNPPHDISYLRDQLRAFGGREITIGTPDGEKLNAMLFCGEGKKSRGAVIATFGNNTCYERSGGNFFHFVRNYVGKDVDILVLNTRGCGKSTGSSSPQGMALDVYSAGEYILNERNVVPVFTGHSLGGYTAIKGAGLFQKQHPEKKVSALSDRSFTSLSDAAYELFGRAAAWLIYFLNWELDPRNEWDALRGRKIVVHHAGDWLPAHFVNHARQSGGAQIVELEPQPHEDAQEAHCRDYTPDEANQIGTLLRTGMRQENAKH